MRRAVLLVLLTAVVACGAARGDGRGLPARFEAVSLSALDSRDFFVLGTLPCASGRCYAIERTSDGGRSFTRIAAPHGLPLEGTGPTLSFADPRNGFVRVPFGWGEFWSTHDGGTTWTRLRRPDVVALTSTAGRVYAVVGRCTPNGCSRYRLASGPASTTRWHESPLPFSPDGPVLDLAARGPDVWLLGTRKQTRFARHDVLARSTDDARTFTTAAGPCFPGLGGTLEPSSGGVVWAVCPTGMLGGASRSTDGGATFAPLRTPTLVNSALLAPASGKTAVLDTNDAGRPLYRTTDGGASWRPIRSFGNDRLAFDIRFTGPRVGEALVGGAVWRTTDAGATWSPAG